MSHGRNYVDFAAVEPAHQAVDGRLENWARWSQGRYATGNINPMWRLCRTPGHWGGLDVGSSSIDALDAAAMQKAIGALPQLHRLALSWCYISRSNPRRMAQHLGQSLEGLASLVRDGRQMLVNRGE